MVEMKPSGVQWLGDIPKEWNLAVLGKYVTQVKNKNVALSETNLLSLSYGKIKRKDISSNDGLLPASFDGYNIIEAGDIVLRLTDLQNDHTSLRVGRATERGIITSAYVTIRPEKYISSEYLYYVLHSFDIVKGFYGMGAGIRQGLTYDGVQSLKLPSPEISEQQIIANYLDDRCSKIDEIIAEATASIEEYKELKQAVIFEAVTKGLDKNVPMKDSGVEWIGSIPVSWTYFKLRYVVDDIGDIDHYMPESVVCGIPYVMTGDLKDIASEIEFDSCKQVSYEDYIRLSKKISVNKGDVIFARYASIGVICYVDIDKDFLVSYSCVTIKPKHDLIDSWFLKYYLQSSAFKEEVMRYANSNVQANVGKESMYQAKIALPSVSEQKAIVNYLDIKVGYIESLISEKQALIDDLQAYKKSLIYEVVTGKRRVV